MIKSSGKKNSAKTADLQNDKTDKVCSGLPLDQTMNRLKESFDRWKSISESSQTSNNNSTSNQNASTQNPTSNISQNESEWLEETRDLLQKLNKQLDHLSS